MSRLKTLIPNYIREDPTQESRFRNRIEDYMTLLPTASKNFRGFQHVDTASLLCPLRLKVEFEADPV